MAFGRRNKDRQPADPAGQTTDETTGEKEAEAAESAEAAEAADEPAAAAAPDGGPFDIEDFDDPDQAGVARLDLGSVLIPMPPGGQVQVELSPAGVPSAIWVVTPNGRFTIAAYAAPKSPGLWREVAAELADALRNDNAQVSIQDGPWGREVVGTGAGVVRFIGVDGYRWMVRCVVNGNPDTMDTLIAEAREALADTVIRRGDTALPVRTPLPVQLPEELAAQLRAAATQQAQQAQMAMLAAQQAMAQQQAAQQAQQAQQSPDPAGQAGEQSPDMQQLRSPGAAG